MKFLKPSYPSYFHQAFLTTPPYRPHFFHVMGCNIWKKTTTSVANHQPYIYMESPVPTRNSHVGFHTFNQKCRFWVLRNKMVIAGSLGLQGSWLSIPGVWYTKSIKHIGAKKEMALCSIYHVSIVWFYQVLCFWWLLIFF